MHELLIGLQQRLNQTVVFVTHDPEEAVKLADRVLVMDKSPGRLRQEFAVELPRPRQLDSPGFLEIKRSIYGSLRGRERDLSADLAWGELPGQGGQAGPQS